MGLGEGSTLSLTRPSCIIFARHGHMGSCLKGMGASRIKRWTVPVSVVAGGKDDGQSDIAEGTRRETTVQPVVPSAIWPVWALESSDGSLETVQIVFQWVHKVDHHILYLRRRKIRYGIVIGTICR